MSELVTTYLLSDLDQPLPMDRDEFYEEQIRVLKKTGKPTRAVEVVQVILFTPDKEFILQKRSKRKNHNPGMFDKTLGGHIRFGNTPTYTVMAETLEELEVPAFVLSSEENFRKTHALLQSHINNTALIQFVDSRTYNSHKIINRDDVIIANTYHFYLGVYSGSIKPADKEASGVLFLDAESLHEEIQDAPNLFTDDLKFFLMKYEKQIGRFFDTL